MNTKRQKIILLCSVALCLIFGRHVLAQEDVVRVDVEALVRALYDGDIETALRYANPAVIELNGGPDAFRQVVEETVQALSESGMKFESLSFPESPTFYQGNGRRFAVVPTLLVVTTMNGQRFESRNYQLGVLDDQSDSWTYIEGARLHLVELQRFYPGFPEDIEFPRISGRSLD